MLESVPLLVTPGDFGHIAEPPDRKRILRQAIDFGTRSFVPAEGETRIDPLLRLFDPTFTEVTWYHEQSKVGELPGKLHAKQLEALTNPAKHRWLFWGNQVGKTSFGAIDCALMALGRHPLQRSGVLRMPPVTGWASALTWELWEKILLPELLSWIPAWRVLDAPPAFNKSTKRDLVILADNGQESRITGKAAEQGAERYQSARLDFAWLDEEHPEPIWDELQPRMLRFGGRSLATMTPLKGLCLPGDVRVTTARGMVPLTEVRVGDTVVGRANKKFRVSALFDNGLSPMVEVTTRRGYRVRCTPNHPWLAADSRRGQRDTHARRERDASTLRKVNAEDLTTDHWLALSTGGRWMWPASERTAEDGYFLGQMTGDGSWRPRRDAPGAMKLTTADAETREWFHVYLRTHGVASREYAKRGNAVSVEWSSRAFATTIETWGVDLTQKAWDKEVPECVWRGSEALARGFLQGVFDADGFAHPSRDRIGFVSTSERLARGVALLLLRFGVRANLAEYEDGHAVHRRQYRLEITASDARRFGRVVGFRLARKQAHIRSDVRTKGRELYDRVVSVRALPCEEHTYCLTVDDPSHLFQAAGFFSGNTWVHGRIYEPVRTGRIPPDRHWYSHAGLRDNPSITPEARAEMLEELKHNPAQVAARDLGLFVRPEGAVLPWDPEKHLVDVTPERMTILKVRGAWYGALDLGKWRFAFQFGVADTEGNMLIVDEYFSQNEDADTRARGMHTLLKAWRVPDSIMIPADCADPNGIQELNEAFDRISSPYRVYAIDGALKARTAGIARVENLMNRGALKVRRGMGADHSWNVHRSASGPGKPIMGSRWMWEIANWLYPKTAEGKVQKDEPDDASADGADMMDGLRYIAMSFFPADAPPKPKKNPTVQERIQKELEDLDREEELHHDRASGDRYGGILRQ